MVSNGVDVLLVLIAQRATHSACSDVTAPIGIAYIASALECAGFHAEIEVYNPANTPEQILRKIRELQPTILGLSATSAEISELCELALVSKRAIPGLLVIAGGYCSLDAQRVLSGQAVDIVVHGEGEEILVEIAQRVLSGGMSRISWSDIAGISFCTPFGPSKTSNRLPIADIDGLPIPDYTHDPPDTGIIRVYSSRGCPYECTFCRIKDYYGSSRIRTHSESYMRRSIKHLIDRSTHPIRLIYFNDDEFMLLPEHFLAMARVTRDFGLRMCFQTRTQDVMRHRRLLEENRDVIFQVHMGVESFAQSQLDRWKKHTTVEVNSCAIRTLSELDVSYYPYLILTDHLSSVTELEQNCRAIVALPPSPFEITRNSLTTRVRLSPLLCGLEFNRMKDLHGNIVRARETNWLDSVWCFIAGTFYESKRLSELYLYSCLSRQNDEQSEFAIGASLLSRRIELLPQLAREVCDGKSHHASTSIAHAWASDFIRESEEARMRYMFENLEVEPSHAVV